MTGLWALHMMAMNYGAFLRPRQFLVDVFGLRLADRQQRNAYSIYTRFYDLGDGADNAFMAPAAQMIGGNCGVGIMKRGYGEILGSA